MPLLSRAAGLVRDYRAARAGVALLGGVGGAFSPLAAVAQDAKAPVQTAQLAAPTVKASFVKPPMALEPHCDTIKLVFDNVKMEGEPKDRIYAWIAGGCKGDVPVPDRSDVYNGRWFETAATILQKGRRIVLTP